MVASIMFEVAPDCAAPSRTQPANRPLLALFWWGVLLLGSLAFLHGCSVGSGKSAVGIVGAGIVNNPSNKSLRFDLLRFGMREFCKELLESGIPLRLADDQPVIGRFFAASCESKSLDEAGRASILIQFSGQGYAWTVGTGRLGFRAQGLLELAPDFRLHDDSLYVYFRPIHVDTSDFNVLMTENALTEAVLSVTQVDEEELGQAIINAQLGRGFTVIRYDADGHTDFALGLLAQGQRPFRPFTILSSPKRTLANGRTELFVGQQDYLGRFQVQAGETLSLILRVEGAPSVDFVLIAADKEPQLIENYVRQSGPVSFEQGVVFQSQAGSGAPARAEIPVPPGSYYLAFDHSAQFGAARPTEEALPARVDYLVQAGAASR